MTGAAQKPPPDLREMRYAHAQWRGLGRGEEAMADRQHQAESYDSATVAIQEEVVGFSDARRGGVRRIQTLLHQVPAIVPLIVLLVSVLAFGLVLGL